MSRSSVAILFGGAGREEAIFRLLEEGYQVTTAVVPRSPSPRLKKSIDSVRSCGVSVVPCSQSEVSSVVSQLTSETLISIGFPFLLSDELLSGFKLTMNVHPTLLPKYRGATSGAFVLINGEWESGSTVHLISAEVDGGNIICQSRVQLSKFDTVRSLQRKVYATEPELLIRALRLVEGNYLGEPQVESPGASLPRSRKPDDSEIDPTKSLLDLFDEIRACDPEDFPAFFWVDGQKVCVRLWRPHKPSDESDLV